MQIGRLSSDYLYHFKRDPDVLGLILKYGFRHNSWPETLPYHDVPQHNFVVCFCDIRFEDSSGHRQCYGHNGIALTKEWGIRNNIAPVRYIHPTSPGATEDYLKLRRLYRSALGPTPGDHDRALLFYLAHCVLEERGLLPTCDLRVEGLRNPAVLEQAQELQREFVKTLNIAQSIRIDEILLQYLHALMDKIHLLHNELEMRDAFMRAYQEDFEHSGTFYPKKVLYDEMEWRSIKFPTISQALSDPQAVQSWISQKYLPSDENLRFNNDDVVAILTQDELTKSDILCSLKAGDFLVGIEAIEKIYTVDEYARLAVGPHA